VEKRVCCSIQLSYRTREGVTRTRTGNPQITCSSSCIRRRFPRWRQQLTRVSRAALWKRPRSGCRNPPYHVLPPAFASRILYKANKETTETFYRDRICSPGQHSASQQSHWRQLLTRFLPANLLSANIDRKAGVEPARNYVIPPAFATNLRRGRQGSWSRRDMFKM
jgi:hypothetical protein